MAQLKSPAPRFSRCCSQKQNDPVINPISAEIAIRHRIATIYDERVYVDRGGLVSFEMYHEDPVQRIASMIDKVFRGMKPADIPWELPDRSHLAINLVTARLLGLTVPPDLLLLADQVVE